MSKQVTSSPPSSLSGPTQQYKGKKSRPWFLSRLHDAMIPVNLESLEALFVAVRPAHGQEAGFRLASKAKKQPAVVGRQVRSASLRKARQSALADPERCLGSHDIGVVLAD